MPEKRLARTRALNEEIMTFPYEIPRNHINECKAWKEKNEIIKEFTSIINRHSLENDSNTPDFILAEYLFDCLISANILICARSIWYNPTNNDQFPELGEK